MSFKIVADSSANLLSLDGVDFSSVSLKIITQEKEYVDNQFLDIDRMIAELETYKGKSSTSCPNAGDWMEACQGADEIFALAITSGLSGSYEAALMAGKMYQLENPSAKVHVMDSLSTGPEMQLLIEKIQELHQKGMDFESIKEEITLYQNHTHLLFSLESLKNFANNGRVSPAVASVAGVLGIRIVGRASDRGTLELLHKCRGRSCTMKKILKEMKHHGYAGGKVRIAHCNNEEGAKELLSMIEQLYGECDIQILPCRGLCCYYAEKGGLLVGFED